MNNTQRNGIGNYISDFIALFFPNLCLICHQNAITNSRIFCFSCEQKLPFTTLHLSKENDFTDRFWGRLTLEAGAALFYFSKDSLIQPLIYGLKYGDRPTIGIELGRWYGNVLKSHILFSRIDMIVPVPLHSKRQQKRGYNQSIQFAVGLSEVMGIPYNDTHLQRIISTTTQTKKMRAERFENVSSAFHVKHPAIFENKHILLVDDVLTTGATLEACATKLLAISGVKISMATIAMATF